MLIFTLAISCLTTSNLPWFMDLTFQVPMQYYSLQHRTLLSPVDVSTTESHFYFGPASSFFLELFLHSSLVAYWTPTDLGGSSYGVIFLPFHIVHGILEARILKWFAIPFSIGPCFVKNSPPWPILHAMTHSFIKKLAVGKTGSCYGGQGHVQ